MNTISMIGRLCYENEVNKAEKGDTVYLNNVVAIDRDEDNTDFIPFVAFNGTAEFIKKYFEKGQRIGLVGRLTSSNYKDKDGNERKQLTVVVTSVDFCEPAQKKEEKPAERKASRYSKR